MKFNIIPQAGKPALEWMTNYNFFTQESIVPMHMEGVESPYQYRDTTTIPAKWVGKAGISPMQFENAVRGYAGTLGMWSLNLVDYVAHTVGFGVAERPGVPWSNFPVVRRFVKDGLEGGLKASYYDFKDTVQSSVQTMRRLRKHEPERVSDYVSENMNTLAMRDLVREMDKQLKLIRERRSLIYGSTGLSRSDKEVMVRNLDLVERRLLANIPDIRRRIGV